MPDHLRAASLEEQGRWTASIEAALAREPTWGVLITRLFGDDVVLLGRREAELR